MTIYIKDYIFSKVTGKFIKISSYIQQQQQKKLIAEELIVEELLKEKIRKEEIKKNELLKEEIMKIELLKEQSILIEPIDIIIITPLIEDDDL